MRNSPDSMTRLVLECSAAVNSRTPRVKKNRLCQVFSDVELCDGRNMTGRNTSTRLLIAVAIIVTCAIATSEAAISDRRLCYDPKCSVAVSEAITLMAYPSNDPGILSFESNAVVTVFSKSAGNRKDLWGVEINGQRGYVPWKLIKEKRVWRKTLKHEVPTEQVIRAAKTTLPDEEASRDNEEAAQAENVGLPSIPQPSQVSPSFEVHDGTTIPVAVNEEAPEPSYSTATLESGPQDAEHPVLSVHPNIAPAATPKNDDASIDESIDAEKYLKMAGLSEGTRGDERAEESPDKTNESGPTVNEAKPEDASSTNEVINYTSEKNILDESPPKTETVNVDEVTHHLSAQPGADTPKMDVEPKAESSAEEREHQKAPEPVFEEHELENTFGMSNALGDEGTETSEHRAEPTTLERPEQQREEPTTPETPEKPREEPEIPEEHRVEPTTPETAGHRAEPTTPETAGHRAEPTTPETAEHRAEPTSPETQEQHREEPTTPDAAEHRAEPTPPETQEQPREEPTTPETAEHRAEPTPPETQEQPREEPTRPETAEHRAEPTITETQEHPREEPMTPETPEQPREEPKTHDQPVEHQDEKPSLKEELEKETPVTEPQSDGPDSPEVKADSDSVSAETGSQQEGAPSEAKSDENTSTRDESAENGIDRGENATLDNAGSGALDNETLKEDSQPSENAEAAENSAHVIRDNIEEASGKKSSEEVPPSVNILNPLFNRLSVLSTMSREERVTRDEDAGEPGTTRSDEADAGTNVRDDADKVDADSSAGSDTGSETIEPESIERSDAEKIVNIVDNSSMDVGNGEKKNDTTADSIATRRDVATKDSVQPGIYKEDDLSGFGRDIVVAEDTSRFNGFPANRNLLNVGSGLQPDSHKLGADSSRFVETENLVESKEESRQPEADGEGSKQVDEPEIVTSSNDDSNSVQGIIAETADSCLIDSTCQQAEDLEENHSFAEAEDGTDEEEVDILDVISMGRNYWETLTYLVITACTTLLFSLGYYYIENARRDGHYIAKINQLEKQLLVCSKECTVLDDTLKSTKTKLDSIEDESFGSNEMVASLKADLEASKTAKAELEDQVAMLEKEVESATEAGLELERMLREVLSTNNEDNPLAKSVEDLQTRLNAQQAANEALTNALNLKAQENEHLTAELKTMSLKSEQLEVEVSRLSEELKQQRNLKSNLEQTLLEKVENLEDQVKDITAERINLRKQLKGKEMELKDLLEVVNQMNTSDLDFEKLYEVSSVKAEASQLLEERDELKVRLSEVEGAHQLLEEHVKLINEEVSSLSEQCRLAEKAKRDAETRVEVLSNFFKEKETQRQKEEAIWLEKQGEVSSTVERLHAMQNEIHNYKQQIEMLKREILDQEREYKNQISALETKSHENWVVARQNERRLEESKVEASQLRNRLTLIEKNINDADPDVKLHRLEVNGETPTSPQLFMGAEASSSPIMFAGSSGVPLPPPPSYLYGPHPVPPFMPPPLPPHASSAVTSSYEPGQRPPPLGGRLSSPPPLPSANQSRYDDHRSPPTILQSFGPPHRGFPAFPNDRTHPPPPPHSIPPPLGSGSSHTWPDDPLPPPPPLSSLRNAGFQAQHQIHHRQPHHHHQQQQQQQQQHHHHHRDGERRARNHKGSLHSSGESLDKNL